MKKFMMYVVVLIAVLFVGFTAYYFCRNNETITLTLADSEIIYLNEGETYDLPIAWNKPFRSTSVYENVKISNTSVLSFNKETKKFVAQKGGIATVTVKPSNEEFGPFVFDIHVGDGSIDNPYFVNSAEKIQAIGASAGDKWQKYHCYQLICDINLTLYNENEWTPVGDSLSPFTGTFDGAGYEISNMKVTQATENAGLFGVIGKNSVVENIVLKNPILQGDFSNCGAVVGMSYGKIGKCQVINAQIKNSKLNSRNGGIVGTVYCNMDGNNRYSSRNSVEMCSSNYIMQSAGVCGGIAGEITTGLIFNCKSTSSSVTLTEDTASYGGIVGNVKSFVNSFIDDETSKFNIIKNCLVIIPGITTTSTCTTGIVVGNMGTTGNEYENRCVNIYYIQSSIGINPIGDSDANTLDMTFNEESNINLQKQNTYDKWNFIDVWMIEENAGLPEINFIDGVYTAHGEIGAGDPIVTKDALVMILNGMRLNPNVERTYIIEDDIDCDLEGMEWQTIAPDFSKPLRTSLICKEGVSATIRNFKLSGNNESFFGYVSDSSTMISGINFKDVTVSTSSTANTAVVASRLTDATLENINVSNVNITAQNAENVGMVVAINNGIMNNITVNKDAIELNTINCRAQNVVVGSVVGANSSSMTNITTSMVKIELVDNSSLVSAFVGGVSGKGLEGSRFINCYNYDVFLKQTYLGKMWFGGIVGQLSNDGSIDSCFSNGLFEVNVTNSDIVAAGITSSVGINAKVIKSFYSLNSLTAHTVAGLVANNKGYIDQCYMNGELKGQKIGGLCINNESGGKILNCAAYGSIDGYNSSSTICGVCYVLSAKSVIENCFSTITFGGTGKAHAETTSQFRAKIENWLDSIGIPNKGEFGEFGAFKNNIVVNYGNADVKGGLIKDYPFIKCSDDEAKGISGNYSKFKDNAKFDQAIWTFERGDAGAYPTLTNVVIDPLTLIVDED